mgnify:CR=1 FL=1
MLQPFKGLFEGPICRSGEAGGEGWVWERTGVHPRRRINRCRGHHAESLKVPILFMGLSLPEHGYHAPNEYFDWGQASGGMKAFAHYFAGSRE